MHWHCLRVSQEPAKRSIAFAACWACRGPTRHEHGNLGQRRPASALARCQASAQARADRPCETKVTLATGPT
eukprot:998493-Alexandrium_andersonii.AAC.1